MLEPLTLYLKVFTNILRIEMSYQINIIFLFVDEEYKIEILSK